MAAVLDIRCTEGCGGSVEAIIGLVVAFLSLGIAIKAWQVAARGLRIANTEHQVFMEQLARRADFQLDLYLVHPAGALEDGSIIETNQPEIGMKWQMGIKNTGDKPASDVEMNFLIPTDADRFGWVSQDDKPLPHDPKYGPLTTAEELPGSDGSKHPAHYLVKETPRVSLRGTRVGWASAVIKMPEVGMERVVPVKFKVWSDDMPDDVENRVVTMQTTIRRVA